MKTLKKTRFAELALTAIIGTVGFLNTATAIPFTWLNGPEKGQAFAGGAITVKAFNYDTGTLYNTLPINSSLGYSGNPGAGVAGGEATLNNAANVFRPATNAAPGEDSWGIIKLTQITAVGSDGLAHSIYSEDVNNFELTALFWGVKDFHVTQVSAGNGVPGSGQVIDGTGLRVDIYMDYNLNFSQLAGPTGHAGNAYATATDGSLELSLLSTAGFINPNGTFGGTATEFESNTANVGYAALNVIGGSAATVAQFDTNSIGFKGSSGSQFTPGLAGQASTDVWFAFTATQGDSGWDIRSNDPMLANISGSVPDSGATLLLLGCALPLMVLAARRHSRVLAA